MKKQMQKKLKEKKNLLFFVKATDMRPHKPGNVDTHLRFDYKQGPFQSLTFSEALKKKLQLSAEHDFNPGLLTSVW